MGTLTLAYAFPASAQKDTIADQLLDPVVVSANKTQVSRNNVPMTITVVGREKIEDSRESALLPVLSQRVPGMFVSERGVTGFGVAAGAAGGITMRGIGGTPNTQVLILIDGHPQFMGINGHPLPDAYVASDVEKVEVIRGPGSILYGTNAMGGVINIITRRQNSEGWSANGRAMIGSFNTQKYMGNAGLKNDRLNLFVSLNRDQTDGHRDNSAFWITNGFANLGYRISDHFNARADVSIADYSAQNPGSVARPMFDNVAKILRGVGSVSIENRYEKFCGALSFFYNWGRHTINDGYTTGGQPRDFRYRSADENYGLMFYQAIKPFKGTTITAGVEYKNYGGHAWNRFLDGRPDVNLVDTTVYELAGYGIVQQNLLDDKLTLNAGLRLEHSDVFGQQWVPQAGFAYRPEARTVIRASVSKGFRSPTIREMFINAANPQLEPERMVNYDLSVGHAFLEGKLNAELTGFIVNGSNLIKAVTIDSRQVNMNTGEFRNRGIELAVDWMVMKGLSLNANYSYLHMEIPVVYAPRQHAFLSASYQRKKWGVSLDYQLVNDLYLDVANAATESYGLLGARASYNPIPNLGFFIKGENLTDRDYQVINGFPMPGITVFAGLNLHFGKQ